MCSINDQAVAAPAAARARGLAALVAHQAEVGDLVAAMLRDPRVAGSVEGGTTLQGVDLGALPADLAAELCTALLAVADRAQAAATVLAGHVVSSTGPGTGTLIAATYASPGRWMEVEADLAPGSARALLARSRDLREHGQVVQNAWLAGEVAGDAVRELTAGVTQALKPVTAPRADKERMRAEAVEILLPVARAGTPADVMRAVQRMRLLTDPDGASQAASDAYDDQSLTCVQVGSMSVLTAHLTHESAAAVMTVIDRYARRIADRDLEVVHDDACELATPAPEPGRAATRWCSCGAAAAAGVTSKDRWQHLLAVSLGELATTLLDDGQVGSHHGIAPHITLQMDVRDLAAGIGADLVMPGSDQPVPLPPDTARRIRPGAGPCHRPDVALTRRAHDPSPSTRTTPPELAIETALRTMHDRCARWVRQDAAMQSTGVRRFDFGYFVRPGEETRTGAPRVEAVLGYVVEHPGGVLLFDTGMGSHPDVDAHYRPTRTGLEAALRAAGHRLDEITEVANCHLHFDHCGGNPLLVGRPFFAQADELAEARRSADYTLPELVDPDGSSWHELSGRTEVLPGVTLIPTPGHTDGHQSLIVRRNDGVVVVAGQSHDASHAFASDALAVRARREGVPDPVPVPPEWMEVLLALDPAYVVFAHDHSVWRP